MFGLARRRSVHASPEERQQLLPGDARIIGPCDSLTHAITISRPPQDVWPWLAQMGAGHRAGWYSYDWLDNRGHRSADQVQPELQRLTTGMVFPALPGVTDCFTLLDFEASRYLVLGWLDPRGTPRMTWAFVLEERTSGTTRLLVRARTGSDYHFGSLPRLLTRPVGGAVHFVMQRRQLKGIAERVERRDALLDQFMPRFDVVERHHAFLHARQDMLFRAARNVDLFQSRIVTAIVRLRERVLGVRPAPLPHGPLLSVMQSFGWGILAEQPGREVVLGAVTQPWEGSVAFRALAPADFNPFAEPGYVKIAWTLRVDPVEGGGSMFSTETRAFATDPAARARFRRYWRIFSPGIVVIRWLMLAQVRAQVRGLPAEERAA